MDIKAAKPAKGESVLVSNGPLMIIKHHDKRQVTLCSTVHTGEIVDTGKVFHATKEPITKPDCIVDYNKFMGSVDRSHHMVQYFAFGRKTLKWYKKVIMHLMDLCTTQAYILYRTHTDNPVPHRVFNIDLIQQILNTIKLPEVSAAGGPRTNPVVLQRLNNNLAMHSIR